MYVCKHHSLHVEVRGQLVAVSVLIPPCGFWDWTKVIRLDAFTNWTVLLTCFQRCLGCFSVPVLVILCLSSFIMTLWDCWKYCLSIGANQEQFSLGLRKSRSRFSLSLPSFPFLLSFPLSVSLPPSFSSLLSSFPLKCIFWSSVISWICCCLLIVCLGRVSPCDPDWPQIQMPPASTLWRCFCSYSFPQCYLPICVYDVFVWCVHAMPWHGG